MNNNTNNESIRLLIVADSQSTRDELRSAVRAEGYQIAVSGSTEDVSLLIASRNSDVCLIDEASTSGKALALTRAIRAASDVGILLINGASDPLHRVLALESGADDSFGSPWDSRELLSRIKNLIWRMRTSSVHVDQHTQREFAGWTFYIHKRELVTPDGSSVRLSSGEFHLLSTLIENAGRVTTREALMQRICNREWHPYDRYVDVLVSQVRRKFKTHDQAGQYITTIHGSGYLFEPQVN